MIKNPVSAIPAELEAGDILTYKVVAVIGHNNDWAAYKGFSRWTDEEVAISGDKLSKKAAEALFYAPKAAGLDYRE